MYKYNYMVYTLKKMNTIDTIINRYLDNCSEPPYQNLCHYDYEIFNKIIEEKRTDLEEKMQRLDKFQDLINHRSFPLKHYEIQFKLLKSKPKVFYEIMNDECKYVRGKDEPVKILLWSENNNTDEFCTATPTGLKLCDSCKYYLRVIQEYKKST